MKVANSTPGRQLLFKSPLRTQALQMRRVARLGAFAACLAGAAAMGCMDEDGNAVDWWMAFKFPSGGKYVCVYRGAD